MIDGTQSDPFQITNNDELFLVNYHLDSYFILMNDLDLSDDTGTSGGKFFNNGNGWISIGNDKETFSGVFYGNNKCIKGLTQKRVLTSETESDLNYGGLFRYVSGTVKNLELK